jgi:hypothetical protein
MLLQYQNNLIVKTLVHFDDVLSSNFDGCVHLFIYIYIAYTLMSLCTNVIYKHVHMVMVNVAKPFSLTKPERNKIK